MAAVETEIINRSHFKPLTWKRYIDDVFSLWNINKEEINSFIELGNSYHPTIKFTSEISDKEIIFLDTCVYKGERFKERIRSRRANALQTDRNFPIYTFLLLPPFRRQERLYQRRSLKTSENQLFKSYI